MIASRAFRPTLRSLLQLGSVRVPASDHTTRQRLLGSPPYWALQCFVWLLLYPCFETGSIALFGGTLTGFAVFSSTIFGLEILAGTHLSRSVILTFRRQERAAWRIIVVALLCVPLCSIVAVLIGWLVCYLSFGLRDATFASLVSRHFYLFEAGAVYGAGWIGLYSTWSLLQALHSAENARLRAAAAAKDAELIAIKAQLNPHFLFNSLNTLRALVPRDHTAPREAITMLADLLRAALSVQADATIPLRRELETIDAYLALEQLRFEERLRLRRSIDPACLDQPVPPFALQTLIENAVKFGIAPHVEGGEITLEVAPLPQAVRVRITNRGHIAPTPGSTGLGLPSVRQRIAHLFGARAQFRLTQEEDDLVAAELILPATP